MGNFDREWEEVNVREKDLEIVKNLLDPLSAAFST
jgi:hypothetical protein